MKNKSRIIGLMFLICAFFGLAFSAYHYIPKQPLKPAPEEDRQPDYSPPVTKEEIEGLHRSRELYQEVNSVFPFYFPIIKHQALIVPKPEILRKSIPAIRDFTK